MKNKQIRINFMIDKILNYKKKQLNLSESDKKNIKNSSTWVKDGI